MYSKISSSYELKLFRLEEFDLLPKTPGLYSWHITCENGKLAHYHNFFKQKYYKTLITGFLDESYEGDMHGIISKMPFDDINDDLIKIASAVFSPPIYVGISKTSLNKRLKVHKKMLIELLTSEDFLELKKNLIESELDKDEESRYFAGRVATIIKSNCKQLNEGNFFVKVIILPKTFNLDLIKNTEHYLNRTFNPMLGRR